MHANTCPFFISKPVFVERELRIIIAPISKATRKKDSLQDLFVKSMNMIFRYIFPQINLNLDIPSIEEYQTDNFSFFKVFLIFFYRESTRGHPLLLLSSQKVAFSFHKL